MVRKRTGTLICIFTLLIAVDSSASASSASTKPDVTLTIFAASSLSQTFTTIGTSFQRNNPRILLKFSFLASSALATQLSEGAPADIFASASVQDMVNAGSSVLTPKVFASNSIVMAYPRRNGNLVANFSDLNKKSVKWIKCAPSIACGAATDAALKSIGTLKSKPVSLEPKVASVVSKLLAGEVDAAFIYHSDYLANRDLLREVTFPNKSASSTKYLMALVRNGKHRIESTKFLAEVFSTRGKKILATAGFDVTA